ncbi:MAG: hypothetical protein M1294_12700 [Firmicutes bacterium]|uniref:Uncharacterized protein n=1 Tax=Sulfobacillus benefaciens TaxID=453960 RepID=A0A2T2X9W5_9FIRM|nr:hypothetical protein [Bacillota bacterium]MCL5015369.1 hypothetical protein [Bacillota bacterium]PSR31311.1 MAG: hypothetical protein C7B43_02785 [Sulfobacillus benefaciens]
MITKYLWPLVTSLFIVLFGVTLLIWPFALHTNVGGWTRGTTSDFWTGLGVIVIGLLMVAAWYSALRNELIDRGIIEVRKPEPQAPAPIRQPSPGPRASQEDLDEKLRVLAETVLRDLNAQLESKDRRRGGPVA